MDDRQAEWKAGMKAGMTAGVMVDKKAETTADWMVAKMVDE